MRKIVVGPDRIVSVGAVRDAIAGLADADSIPVDVIVPELAADVVTDGSAELKGKKRK